VVIVVLSLIPAITNFRESDAAREGADGSLGFVVILAMIRFASSARRQRMRPASRTGKLPAFQNPVKGAAPQWVPEASLNVYEIFVVSYQGSPPVKPASAVFGPEGGTIGRGSANTLVLPDPNRFVSRVQANVAFNGSRMTIANASTANPLLVNDRELEAGATTILTDGDDLRVGLYLLRVRRTDALQSTTTSAETPFVDDRRSPAGERPVARVDSKLERGDSPLKSPLSDLGAVDPLQLQFGEYGVDPFADLISNQPAQPAAAGHAEPINPTSAAPLSCGREMGINPPAPQKIPPPAAIPADVRSAPSQDRRSVRGPEAPSVSGEISKIPDSVWDDIVARAPAPVGTAPKPVLPENFNPFNEAPRHTVNAEDPLAEFASTGITLDTFDKLDTPVDQLFGDTPLQPSSESIIPDPNAIASNPLATHETLDPLIIFERSSAEHESMSDLGCPRPERDDVSELDAYFRPPEARFDPSHASDPSLVANRVALVASSPTSLAPPATTVPDGATTRASGFGSGPPCTSTNASEGHAVPELQSDVKYPTRDADYSARLLQEFLVGAGIPNASIKEGLTPEMMRKIGTMLAAAVQGTIELIATRALLKREVKAEVTIIAPTRNNPLKFLPDAESALLQMFGNRIPGFMSPVEAMHDAFKDLRAHEVGLIAGMHAALEQVLHRFEPAELEKRLKAPGMLERMLPNSHKSRLWEEFAEMYVDISREAQDDFQSLFGKAFLQAYDNEVSRLKGE
jgi:FHA domain-containing protein